MKNPNTNSKAAKKVKCVVKTTIPGEVLGNFSCDYGDGNPVAVYTVLVDAKYICGSDGLKGHLTAATTNASIAVNMDGNVTTIPAGSVVVFLSQKTQSRFRYSKKAITVLSRYEAAKAYFYNTATQKCLHANIDAEEFAVAYLAKSTANKMWKCTVFSILEKYDKRVRKFEKKYFGEIRKALRNIDVNDESIEIEDAFVEAFEELASITT